MQLDFVFFNQKTVYFFFSSRRRHTRSLCDWSSDVCSSDLPLPGHEDRSGHAPRADRPHGRGGTGLEGTHPASRRDRKSVVQGKGVGGGGRRSRGKRRWVTITS